MLPFHVHLDDQVLTLELNTPGTSVNVFGLAAAEQLRECLRAMPSTVRLVLLRSSKPGSFVNGAGLLYAQAVRSPLAARKVTRPVREAYEVLAACRARTVAVIEGNCYGCGLELALCCDARVARDVAEVELRMTELVDYRFVPLFGGTWRLPRLVGAPAAKRLVLDGERWTARQALAVGLVDAVLPDAAFEAQLDAWLMTGRRPSLPRRVDVRARAGSRWPPPPTRAELWTRASVLLKAAERGPPGQARRKELDAFSRSVTGTAAKRAMEFFYVRHMARAAGLGSTARRPPQLTPAWKGRGPLRRSLSDRKVGIALPRALTLVARGDGLAVAPGMRVRFPDGPHGVSCEVAAAASVRGRARELAVYLEWLGYQVVLTRGGRPVTDQLLDATGVQLRAWRDRGISAAAINRGLWEFGLGKPLPVPGWPRGRGRKGHPGAVAALAATWLSALARCGEKGALFHLSQGDLLATDLFDFPLEQGGLLRWVDRVGLGRVLAEAAEGGFFGDVPSSLAARAATGARFYS